MRFGELVDVQFEIKMSEDHEPVDVIRKLNIKSRWDPVGKDDSPEAQADALSDLITQNNALSVYFVKDEQEETRVVAALAHNRDVTTKFDYAILSEEQLDFLEGHVEETPGQTRDNEVNTWHRNLSDLTATHVSELANKIIAEGEIKRIQRNRVKKIIETSKNDGHIIQKGYDT